MISCTVAAPLAYSSFSSILASALLQACTFFRPCSCLVRFAGPTILCPAPATVWLFCWLLLLRSHSAKACSHFCCCFSLPWPCPELLSLLLLPLPASVSASSFSCLCLYLGIVLFLLCSVQLFTGLSSLPSPATSYAADIVQHFPETTKSQAVFSLR